MADEFSTEEVLSHLAHRPRYILRGLVQVDESTRLSFPNIKRKCHSSLGRLDDLPIELLHATCNLLDLRSLACLSRVSLLGKAVVESLPAYRDLWSSAGHVFQVLSRTKVVGMHSVAVLYAALRSDRCASCGNYGAFLFLLSFKRCCYACLSINQSLWMIPRNLAKATFDLKAQDLKALPVMRSIPGVYSIRSRISRRKPLLLTSVGIAKELALQVHGSSEGLARSLAATSSRIPTKDIRRHGWLGEAPLRPLSQDPLTLVDLSNVPNDNFCGMGSVPFPSLSSDGLENGLWCRGCERTFEIYRSRVFDQGMISGLVPPGSNAHQVIMGLQYRARSRAEILEHVKQCPSAREVITKRWIGLM